MKPRKVDSDFRINEASPAMHGDAWRLFKKTLSEVEFGAELHGSSLVRSSYLTKI